jgi:hypothetical protein
MPELSFECSEKLQSSRIACFVLREREDTMRCF